MNGHEENTQVENRQYDLAERTAVFGETVIIFAQEVNCDYVALGKSTGACSDKYWRKLLRGIRIRIGQGVLVSY